MRQMREEMVDWLRRLRPRVTNDITYFELRDALDQRGCPICWLARRTEGRYLRALMREGVMDPDTRDRVRRAGGFCPAHGTDLAEGGDALGAAIIGQDLVGAWRSRLAETPDPPGRRHPHPGLSEPAADCPACAESQAAAGRYLLALAECAVEPEVAERLAGWDGLCLPHFRSLLALEPGQHERGVVLAAQEAALQRLGRELAEFIRKRDYRFAGEPFGAEADSWQRALRLLSGGRPPEKKERL